MRNSKLTSIVILVLLMLHLQGCQARIAAEQQHAARICDVLSKEAKLPSVPYTLTDDAAFLIGTVDDAPKTE